jgi:hypothetical protein
MFLKLQIFDFLLLGLLITAYQFCITSDGRWLDALALDARKDFREHYLSIIRAGEMLPPRTLISRTHFKTAAKDQAVQHQRYAITNPGLTDADLSLLGIGARRVPKYFQSPIARESKSRRIK